MHKVLSDKYIYEKYLSTFKFGLEEIIYRDRGTQYPSQNSYLSPTSNLLIRFI